MNRFKTIRESLGVSQEEMAEALDCSQGNVSLLDRGQTVLPETAKRLIAFAAKKGHRITYEDIYGPVRLPRKMRAGLPRADRPDVPSARGESQ